MISNLVRALSNLFGSRSITPNNSCVKQEVRIEDMSDEARKEYILQCTRIFITCSMRSDIPKGYPFGEVFMGTFLDMNYEDIKKEYGIVFNPEIDGKLNILLAIFEREYEEYGDEVDYESPRWQEIKGSMKEILSLIEANNLTGE